MIKTISHWPDQKRMAVMITVMFEVWSEGKAPPYSPMTTSLRPGTADLLGISWSEYGGKTGVWRFMRIFDDIGVKATVHAHFGGRPLMSAMLHELLRYMKGFPGVWYARHDEVARWALKTG